MTLEEYNKEIASNFTEQEDIAKRLAAMAHTGKAHPGDNNFKTLMARQEQLIQDAKRLTDRFLP